MNKIYLILVDAPNESAPERGNNKYYNMADNGDGTFTARYGRVGDREQVRSYAMALWDKKYSEKLRKGYKDVSELQSTNAATTTIEHDDPLVKTLLDDLYQASNGRARRNYNLVSFGSVTQAMLDQAQGIIDEIAVQIGLTTSVEWYRRKFIELYTTIPRRMDNVESYLPQTPGGSTITKLVENEQETLESLRGQVVVAATGKNLNLLEAMGVSIKPIQQFPPDVKLEAVRWRRGFEVTHEKTYVAFEKYAGLTTKFLYHGSRRANWLSILQSGLQIRPAANGTNFGSGIYFADDPRKSRSYTDAYMGVYEVAIGRQHETRRTDSRLSLDRIEGDSVLAYYAGFREYIIYRPEQCRIRFFLDVR